MIRVRLRKGVTGDELIQNFDYEKVAGYYRKYLGEYEIQLKLTYPSNVRIQNWDDNRVPWILFKFLLSLEAGVDYDGMIKIYDSGKYKILKVKDTLSLIEELSKYTDIVNRLSFWYSEYLDGKLKI